MLVIPDTDPYPWPWNGELDPTRMCLLVAGVQRVHADASPTAHEVATVIDGLAVVLRRSGATVCHVRHTAPSGPSSAVHVRSCRPSATKAGLRCSDRPTTTWSSPPAGTTASAGSGLDLELRARRIDLIVAVGMAAEVAVSCTVRSANDRGYECLTLSDATAPLDGSTGARELHSVTMSGGIFGAVGTSDALLAALERLDEPAALAG